MGKKHEKTPIISRFLAMKRSQRQDALFFSIEMALDQCFAPRFALLVPCFGEVSDGEVAIQNEWRHIEICKQDI